MRAESALLLGVPGVTRQLNTTTKILNMPGLEGKYPRSTSNNSIDREEKQSGRKSRYTHFICQYKNALTTPLIAMWLGILCTSLKSTVVLVKFLGQKVWHLPGFEKS